jgi:hypothetical protein
MKMKTVERFSVRFRPLSSLVSSNSFFSLSSEEIIHTTSDMGIDINHDDFATFDLLKSLEMARDDLYVK